MKTTTSSERLRSLDLLRGFDIFMLVFLQPVLLGLLKHFPDNGVAAFFVFQLDHEVWQGFRAWDLVMPLFLFMSGVAMPFTISHYGTPGHRAAFLKRLLKRVVILFVLGMVVQGNLLAFDAQQLRLFSNTLQSIAVGYGVTALVLLTLSVRWQVAVAVLLLLIYWAPMAYVGDYTPQGNFAEMVDRAVLGRFRDGVWWDEAGWHFSPDYSYTWIWSSLTFSFSVLSGALAGHVVRRKTDKTRNALWLFWIGVGCTVAGWLWGLEMPIVKRLWTSSMALYSSGLCFLLLAAFYYVVDCKGYGRKLTFLNYYGMNCIVAYMLGEWLNFRSVVDQFTYGLSEKVGDYYPLVLTLGNVVLIFLILQVMYRAGKFVKI